MAAFRKRYRCVEKIANPLDDTRATHFIIMLATLRTVALRDHIGAIKRVIETAPACICCIEGVASIGSWNYELRSGDSRDFQDIFGADGEIGGLREKIADRAEKSFVVLRIEEATCVRDMIGVDLRLKFTTKLQLRGNLRCEFGHKRAKPGPETLAGDGGAWQDLGFDEVVKDSGNL